MTSAAMAGSALSYEERSGVFEPHVVWAHQPTPTEDRSIGLEALIDPLGVS